MKSNKKISYIITILVILLIAVVTFSIIQNNKNKNMKTENTVQTPKVAEAGDVIVINYAGRLENGTEFDSSYTKGQPFIFQLGVGQVIKGWDEGLIGIKRGDKKTLKIPADKGYGSQEIKNPNTGEIIIPKDSALIFDVEVVEVIAKADAERMVAEQQAKEAALKTATTTAATTTKGI
jgi:uncharacterized protein YpmB